jgi:hypothetical protein
VLDIVRLLALELITRLLGVAGSSLNMLKLEVDTLANVPNCSMCPDNDKLDTDALLNSALESIEPEALKADVLTLLKLLYENNEPLKLADVVASPLNTPAFVPANDPLKLAALAVVVLNKALRVKVPLKLAVELAMLEN